MRFFFLFRGKRTSLAPSSPCDIDFKHAGSESQRVAAQVCMSSIVPRKRLLRFRAFVRHSILVPKPQNVRGTFTFTTFNESAHSSARMDDDKIEANSGHIRGASEVHGHARLSMQDDSYIQDAIPKNSLNSTRKINKLDIEYVSKEVVEWRDLARLLPEEPITEEELHYIRLQHHSASEREASHS
ncbi:uncharacterized protein LOC115311421 isoform X2 [Ixodes scapularis]|uniref:uncharacterized protein LOC115311421 isoform X2 n=1 Tax=Ixodes scapularis TaxID=6945 RepID=UPI001A9F8F2E|nr:uncharacterized protein LOC115311421 isoform X2 [Ixodes scapularis]